MPKDRPVRRLPDHVVSDQTAVDELRAAERQKLERDKFVRGRARQPLHSIGKIGVANWLEASSLDLRQDFDRAECLELF